MHPRTLVHLATLAVTLVATGCFRAPIADPLIPLDPAEQRQVIACQNTISRQSNAFAQTALRNLEQCADRALRLKLTKERELTSQNIGEFVQRGEELTERCEQGFVRMRNASSRLIDAITQKCSNVEDLILNEPLRGDPLALKAGPALGELEDYFSTQITDLPSLAGFHCVTALSTTQYFLSMTHARASDLAQHFSGITDEDDWSTYLEGFLDPRCHLGGGGI